MERVVLVRSLEGLRHSLVRLVILAAALWALSYPFHGRLLLILQRPLGQPLAYFKATEAFYATLKVSLYASLFLIMPLVFYHLLRFATSLFWPRGRPHNLLVTFFASLLFYAGAATCYFLVLPAGIKFLTAYGQQGSLEPLLSVDRYLGFTVAFIFGFGLTFELPLVMVILAKAGLVNYRWLAKNWRYAIVAIVILAAMVTPTPDVYNLSLMAGPLLVLYGISLLLVKLFGKRG